MSISEFDSLPIEHVPSPTSLPAVGNDPRPVALQRIRAVRREQGMTAKRAAQLMGKSVEQVQNEEEESADLLLTQVYQWQRLLEVPVSDLLIEPHAPLSAPVLRRAQLLRLMKTVQAIMEQSTQSSVRRLAQTMANQLLEIMPELEGVTSWHSLDRRTNDQNARVLERSYLQDTPVDEPIRPIEPR